MCSVRIERPYGAERTGYGKLGMYLERELEKMGKIDPLSPVRIIVAPPYALKGKREGEEVWDFTMFEASRLPESFLEMIDSYEGIIVPNEYNREQYGAEHPNVHVAPLGIDPDIFTPTKRDLGDVFTVMFLGRSLRKGSDLVEDIFHAAFPDAESLSPRPVLVTDKVGGMYSEEDMARKMCEAHVMLGPSRGEGWNLMPFEALATGCPILISDIPGHAPFIGLPGVTSSPTRLIESWLGGPGAWWAGYWWNPDTEQMGARLRGIYENYAQASQAALEGAEYIQRHMTWVQTAEAVLRAVGDAKRPSMGEGVVPLTLRRFEVEVVRPVEASIGGKDYRLQPGLHHLTADVYRVLIEAGYAEGTTNWMKTWEDTHVSG